MQTISQILTHHQDLEAQAIHQNLNHRDLPLIPEVQQDSPSDQLLLRLHLSSPDSLNVEVIQTNLSASNQEFQVALQRPKNAHNHKSQTYLLLDSPVSLDFRLFPPKILHVLSTKSIFLPVLLIQEVPLARRGLCKLNIYYEKIGFT
jgi:hypothetical protein